MGYHPSRLSVYLVDPGVAVIDVNSAFADTHRSGVLVEELTVASYLSVIGFFLFLNVCSLGSRKWE